MPADTKPLRVAIVADFTAANLAAYLTHDERAPKVVAHAERFTGTFASNDATQADGPDATVVWTRAEAISPAYATALAAGTARVDEVLADVDRFAEDIGRLAARGGRVIVMNWSAPRLATAIGSIALREGVGLLNVLLRMNLRLAERLDAVPGVVVLDTSAWVGSTRSAEEAKLWYAAKIPFRHDVMQRAARQVKSTLRAMTGGPRKLIVLDLDDTLWGGIVGDVGWESLRLGGHDPGGEAYADFQRTLLALSRRGILLAVVSKNEETVAVDAMTRHPEMLIRPEHLSGWRINWEDKAGNIADLCRELNLGLDAAVFIDDNPAERARVRSALPDVLVPEWPASPLAFVDALLDLDCFDMVTLTEEDARRAQLYAEERARAVDRNPNESVADWLRRLEVTVDVEPFNERNAPRVVQLLNKTNQMNLTTRRVDGSELKAWLNQGQRALFTFRVRDRFGDAGLTGVASVDVDGHTASIVDFVLSCRVFGRKVEHAMLHVLSEWARERGARQVRADFKPTAKNLPTLRFLETNGMGRESDTAFTWDLSTAFPCPPDLGLVHETAVTT